MGTLTKSSAIRIRVEKEVHLAFMEACKQQGIPASQVLRHFMLYYIENNQSSKYQNSLFDIN